MNINTTEKFNEKWETLSISNDFIFSKLMRDKEICKQTLEILLNFKISNIKYIEDEKAINIGYDAKSIRLDIYAEDDDKIYNIEMQVLNKKDLAKRSRYYQAMIDLNCIEKGESYKKLKDSYVIFICTFDPFGENRPKYEFQNYCKQNKNLKLKDGTYKIFFNSKDFEKEENELLKAFLKYVNGQKDNNDFVEKIDERIRKIKESKEWRQEYMTLLMREREIAEENFEQGMQQGIQQGIQQGMINQIKALKDFGISDDKIIKKIKEDYNIEESEIKKYL